MTVLAELIKHNSDWHLLHVLIPMPPQTNKPPVAPHKGSAPMSAGVMALAHSFGWLIRGKARASCLLISIYLPIASNIRYLRR